MLYYRRRLPHWIPDEAVVFVTWRLAGSAPPSQPEILTAENTGRLPFLVRDQRMDSAATGPVWLRDERVARVVKNALLYGESVRHFYSLHAWVIMPNHIHVVLEPQIALPGIMCWLKGRTARVANRILGRTGTCFWQDESYDHWIRSTEELCDVIKYVEGNPVKAGFVEAEERWQWSSARVRTEKD